MININIGSLLTSNKINVNGKRICTYQPSSTPSHFPGLVPGIEFNSISRPTLVHASTCLVVSRRTGHSTSFSCCTRLYLVRDACFSTEPNSSNFLVMIIILGSLFFLPLPTPSMFVEFPSLSLSLAPLSYLFSLWARHGVAFTTPTDRGQARK